MGEAGSALLTPPAFYSRSRSAANSRYLQNAFAILICWGVLHSGANTSGLATTTVRQRARDVATFRRLPSYKNPIPRGASSAFELVIE